MDPITPSGGATVVIAIVVAAGVMSQRLRKRRVSGGRALPIVAIASAGLLAVGVLLAVTGGTFG